MAARKNNRYKRQNLAARYKNKDKRQNLAARKNNRYKRQNLATRYKNKDKRQNLAARKNTRYKRQNLAPIYNNQYNRQNFIYSWIRVENVRWLHVTVNALNKYICKFINKLYLLHLKVFGLNSLNFHSGYFKVILP